MNREEFVKTKILEKGLTIKEFAEQISMPYTTLLSIINKSVGGASLDNILKICKGLNMDIEKLNPSVDDVSYDESKICREKSDIDFLYEQLDSVDKAEIRGIIKGMLLSDKYKNLPSTTTNAV